MYRIRIRRGDFEVEAEGPERKFVEETIRAHLDQTITKPANSPSQERHDSPPDGGGGDRVALIAKKLDVAPEAAGEVYHEESGEIKLVVAASKLEKDKANATKQIALLVAAGRQASGLDADWTETRKVRDACQDYSRLDSGNFAKTIQAMGDVFSFNGTGAGRKVKVNRPGYERAAELVTQLTGVATKK